MVKSVRGITVCCNTSLCSYSIALSPGMGLVYRTWYESPSVISLSSICVTRSFPLEIAFSIAAKKCSSVTQSGMTESKVHFQEFRSLSVYAE